MSAPRGFDLATAAPAGEGARTWPHWNASTSAPRLEAPASALRAEARWMLGLISNGTHAETIRSGMRRYSDERIMELLTELEALQLVRSSRRDQRARPRLHGLQPRRLRAAHNA